MVQLVGLNCVVCQEKIFSAIDALFCELCGNPVHRGCLKAEPFENREGICPGCTGKVDSPIAQRVQSERKEAKRIREREEARIEKEKASQAYYNDPKRQAREKEGRFRLIQFYSLLIAVGPITGGLAIIFPKIRRGEFSVEVDNLPAGIAAILVGIVLLSCDTFT
jgi:hypothetical protein